MADGGKLREREIAAGFEVALTRCVYYCLHHAYPLHHITSFIKEYERDWSFNSFAVWAGDILEDFVVYGSLTEGVPERRLTQSRKGPGHLKIAQMKTHVEESTFSACRTHFLRCLEWNEFRTPENSPVMKSTLTVYQQAGFGTCWLAAALNLITHVPEARIPFWKALNKKRPMMDDTTIELFVRTPVGRDVFDRYTRKKYRETGKHSDVLEGGRSKQGGSAEDLIEAMQQVIPDLDGLVELLPDEANEMLCAEPFRHIVRNPDDEQGVKRFLDEFDADRKKNGLVGALLSGWQPRRRIGHAIAICYDPELPKGIRVHNHGVSGREKTLMQFLSTFSQRAELTLYVVEDGPRYLFPDRVFV